MLTTIPCMVVFYNMEYSYLYYGKLLRLTYVPRVKRIICYRINQLHERFSLSKQTIGKLEYFSGVIILLLIVVHSTACFWFWLGKQLD